MSNKEILDLKIMGKNISIACPPKDKEVLIQAAEILNNQIESIPDKSNALILASLDLAFKSQIPQESDDTNALSKKAEASLKVLISQIEQSIKQLLNSSFSISNRFFTTKYSIISRTGSFANLSRFFEPIIY